MNDEQQKFMAPQTCGNAAAVAGVRERVGAVMADVEEQEAEQPRNAVVANVDGLNLYVGLRMGGEDSTLLEKVCRCILRGPLALRRDGCRPERRKTHLFRGGTESHLGCDSCTLPVTTPSTRCSRTATDPSGAPSMRLTLRR